MDEINSTLPLLETIVGLVATVYGGVLVWLINKVLGLEKNHGNFKTQLAVFDNNQKAVKADLEKLDSRNESAHLRIEEKIDKHNSRVMGRLDSLVKLAKNGGK